MGNGDKKGCSEGRRKEEKICKEGGGRKGRKEGREEREGIRKEVKGRDIGR